MTRFQLEKLNVDLSQLVPSRDDMKTLVEAFKEAVGEATRKQDPELLHSLCAGIGEVRLRGVCRRLATSERAEMVQLLLPEVRDTSSPTQELISRLFDTAPHLVALQNTFEQIGLERFREEPLVKWFGERAALAEVIGDLKGAEFLNENFETINDAEVALDRIDSVLRHNVSVLESDERLQHVPMAFNAKLLLAAFEEQRVTVSDLVEFAQAWNERIKIHTTTGLGVYDVAEASLTTDELYKIREGLERFPSYVFSVENVAFGISFKSSATGDDGALGACDSGRIILYDAVRGARPDVDFPQGPVDAVTYTTVRETAYSAHTIGMSDFEKISGWSKVSKLSCKDPVTGARHSIRPESFMPGEIVEMDSGRYLVSFHVEPETLHFPLGVSFKNLNKADTESGYLYREDARFVNSYAAMTPQDDYAESLTAFLLTPETLREMAPEKYELMHFLYGNASGNASR